MCPVQQDLQTNLELEQGGNNDIQTALLTQLIAETRKTNMLLCQMAGLNYADIDATTLLPDNIYNQNF